MNLKEVKKIKVKRIKESITEKEFKKLMSYVRGDDSIRENTRINLLRTFIFLYYCGLRLNEVQELKIIDVKNLLKNEMIKIYISKTSSERKVYLTPTFKKEINKLFDFTIEDDSNKIIHKSTSKKTGINNIVFIQQVNSKMKEILEEGFTSHSFRQGLITEMGSKSINIKIISNFIGHKNVSTTLGYIKPTDEQIKDALVR
ncbi:MAG: site-specific integrase [Halarcobacter sp.]